MGQLYHKTLQREIFLKTTTHQVITIWECQFDKQVKEDQEMKDFIASLDIPPRLYIRDSFFGGRTSVVHLHYQAEEGEKIHYYDYTSLYPTVNKYKSLPVGHPQILTRDFDYTMTSYFGIAKIKVLPPRGLYHPVLPYWSGGRLKFPLCRTCADNHNQLPCQCSAEQRSIIGTYCTPEIMQALEKQLANDTWSTWSMRNAYW